jgi:hypothetical protein
VTAMADSMTNTTVPAKNMWTCLYPLCKW